MMSAAFTTPPTAADIQALATAAVAALPDNLREPVQRVTVDDFPSEETERELELESPFDLLASWQHDDPPSGPVARHLVLYRRPILDYWCEAGGDLAELVASVIENEVQERVEPSDGK